MDRPSNIQSALIYKGPLLASSRKSRMKDPRHALVAVMSLRSLTISWWRYRFGLLGGLAGRFHQPLDLSLLTLLNRLESDFGTAQRL
jgi:hypothetical protein